MLQGRPGRPPKRPDSGGHREAAPILRAMSAWVSPEPASRAASTTHVAASPLVVAHPGRRLVLVVDLTRPPAAPSGPGSLERDGPHPLRRADDPRSRRPERRGHGRGHGPDLREPHRVRRRTSCCVRRWPARGTCSTAARRVVFHLRPGLAFSDGTPITGGGRRPELDADHRSDASVAARLAHGRRGRRERLPARRRADPATVGLTASGHGRRGPADASREPVPGHRRQPDVRDRPDRDARWQGRERRLHPAIRRPTTRSSSRRTPTTGRVRRRSPRSIS